MSVSCSGVQRHESRAGTRGQRPVVRETGREAKARTHLELAPVALLAGAKAGEAEDVIGGRDEQFRLLELAGRVVDLELLAEVLDLDCELGLLALALVVAVVAAPALGAG